MIFFERAYEMLGSLGKVYRIDDGNGRKIKALQDSPEKTAEFVPQPKDRIESHLWLG